METKIIAVLFVVLFLTKFQAYGFGLIVSSDRFPYQASLRFNYNNDHHCSGSIIQNKFVLTAGHCVCYYVKYFMLHVVVGADSYIKKGQKYFILKSVCHEEFDYKYLRNDIALLKTKSSIIFSDRVRPVPLINFSLPKSGIAIVAIWEYQKDYEDPPLYFKALLAAFVDNKLCTKYYDSQMVKNTNICTMTSGKGACIGDSGGPVVFKGHLVGIISFGKRCLSGYPNVHTNISAYVDWISDQIFLETNDDDMDYDVDDF